MVLFNKFLKDHLSISFCNDFVVSLLTVRISIDLDYNFSSSIGIGTEMGGWAWNILLCISIFETPIYRYRNIERIFLPSAECIKFSTGVVRSAFTRLPNEGFCWYCWFIMHECTVSCCWIKLRAIRFNNHSFALVNQLILREYKRISFQKQVAL